MLYLGISEDLFDSGVALCDGEKVLFASNEERYTRRKNEGGYPCEAMAALLRQTGITLSDVGMVCFSGIMTPPLPVRLFPFLHQRLFNAKRDKRRSRFRGIMDAVTFLTPLSHSSQQSRLRTLTHRMLPAIMRYRIPRELRRAQLRFVDHHQAHAAAAYTLSGFTDALVVTADGMGDGLSLTVSKYASEAPGQRLWSVPSRDSFGLFFEVLTEAFGFVPCRDEGKLTGLAACGDASAVQEQPPFVMENGMLVYTGPYGESGVRWAGKRLLEKYRREDIAAWAQGILETFIVAVVRGWLQKTGEKSLALAGGVFANVKLNQRLHSLEGVERLFVCPNMGDGGLSLGAICECGGLKSQSLEHAFLGDAFSDGEMRDALTRAGLPTHRCDDVETKCAVAVAAGNLVARFTGAMEWGPRALGNRSILARTTDRQVPDRLNQLLRRSDFMPFAPAMLDREADRYLVRYAPARHAAEFMTVCFDCTPEMQQDHAAVVHVDRTARAQLVNERTNPAFHRILSAYAARTGHGVMLNTSFNIHEEPIVCTPDEAVSTFLRAELDYLALGPFWVAHPKQEPPC